MNQTLELLSTQSDDLIFSTPESWLTDSDPLKTYNFEGYEAIEFNPEKIGSRGGVDFLWELNWKTYVQK